MIEFHLVNCRLVDCRMTDRNDNVKFGGASYSAKKCRIQESVDETWKLISDECNTSPQTSEGVSSGVLTSSLADAKFADASVAEDAFDDMNRGPEEECEADSSDLNSVLSDTMCSIDTSFCSSDSESDNDWQSGRLSISGNKNCPVGYKT